MADRFYNLNDIFKSLSQIIITISSDVKTISQTMGVTSAADLTLHNDLVDLNNKIALLDINNQNTGLTLHKDLTGLNNTISLLDANNQSLGVTLHSDLTGLNNTVYLMDINSQNTGLTLHKDLTTLNTTLNTSITLMDINNQNTGLTLHKDLTTLNSTITLMDINNQSTGLTLHKALSGINTSITLMDINNQSTGLTLHKDLTGINTSITLMDINNQSTGLTLHKALTGIDSKLVQQYNTTNDYSRTGLNIYQIYPKKIYCLFSGSNGSNISNTIFGGPVNTTMSPVRNTFSKNKTLFYWSVLSGPEAIIKIIFEYVDLNGNIQSNSMICSYLYQPLLGTSDSPIGMRSLLTLKAVDYFKNYGQVNIIVTETTTIPTNANNCIGGISYVGSYNGAVVVPTGYIGYLTGFTFYSASTCGIMYTKYYSGNDAGEYTNIAGLETMARYSTNSPYITNLYVDGGKDIIGQIVNPGEGVIMVKQSGITAANFFYGTFILEAV